MVDRIGKQLGNYTLTRFLGKGGFAEVYLGKHVYLNTNAAIKALHVQLASGEQENFLKEARLIASLVHPNIVRVLDFGIDDGTPFLVMDYAPNGTLRQIHPRGTILPLLTVVTYARQIAEGLHYAHMKKMIHRDVKPENLLVGANHEILLSDFGTALLVETIHNQSLFEMSGTVTYMAPEQIQGKPRPASDQYGLAVVVYEWLTGGPPFRGSLTELFTQHILAAPLPLREKSPTIPLDVENVIMTALSKDPDKRFGSVKAFANALEQACLVEQPTISARPPSMPLTPIPEPPASIIGEPTLALPPKDPGSSDNGSAKIEVESEPVTKEPVVSEPISGGAVITPVLSSSTPSTPLSTLSVRKRRISRRTALLGITGIVVVGGAAGGAILFWSKITHKIQTILMPSPPPPTVSPQRNTAYIYRGHTGSVNSLAWSPDGQSIVSGSVDKTVQVWQATSGNELFMYSHSLQVRAVAWSNDGKYIASGGRSKEVQVYDVTTRHHTYTYPGDSKIVSAIAFSPDTSRVADGSGTVQVWDTTTGGHLLVYKGHFSSINGVAWSPDGTLIASASQDHSVRVWHAVTGQTLFTYMGHGDMVKAVAWSHDGKHIASASFDKTVQIFEATTGKHLLTYTDPDTVHALTWSPDDTRIASASGDSKVRVWNATTGVNIVAYNGHVAVVNSVAWSPDGQLIASGGGDTTVQVWSAPA